MAMQRVMLVVDASNLYRTLGPGQKLDYYALIRFACQRGDVIRAAIYVPSMPWNNDQGFLCAMQHIGFCQVVARRPNIRPDGSRKSDIDVSIVLDIWDAALHNEIDGVIICTGDADVIPLIERLHQRKIKVSVVGPWGCTALKLKEVADEFTYATEVEGLVYRQAEPRKEYSTPKTSPNYGAKSTNLLIRPHIH